MANNSMVESRHPWKAWIYLAPALVLLLIFTVWPIINTVRMAFLENYSGLKSVGGTTFKFGLGNFTKVLQYKRFLQCMKNTVLICFLTVPISTMLALLISVALNSIKGLQHNLLPWNHLFVQQPYKSSNLNHIRPANQRRIPLSHRH